MEWLNKAWLKVQVKKYKFAMPELEYLSYIITQEGIKSMHKKVEAILNIKLLKWLNNYNPF